MPSLDNFEDAVDALKRDKDTSFIVIQVHKSGDGSPFWRADGEFHFELGNPAFSANVIVDAVTDYVATFKADNGYSD